MIFIATSGLVSFVLFLVSIYLMMRASAVRPSQLRAADYRSPQGYAYHHQRATIRRQGWMCALAAFMTLGVCMMMGFVQLTYHVD
jgi:formate hydrogenlyase subunit 3/multisubunit Na+/H+ antiporter MnhD subunit